MAARGFLVLSLLLGATACGPVGADVSPGGGGPADGGVRLDGGQNQGTAPSSPDGAASWVDPCSDEAKLVYVVDSSGMFSSFDPRPTPPVFTDLGYLSSCPRNSSETPFSMSVDRNAIAWVLSSEGNLFRVDIKNGLACTKTSFVPGQQGLTVFGMGFVTSTAGGTSDVLYVAGGEDPGSEIDNATLGKILFPDLTLQTINAVSGWPELTGNSNAELWGFYPSPTAPKIARIDTATGAEDRVIPLPGLAGDPVAWAFAFWGGDFWIFLARGSFDPKTAVYRVKGTDGTLTTAIENTGRRIVGAGVSTCAPITLE